MNFDEVEKLREREVRLFPSSHISSEREAEQRATASLLAMVLAVSEFGHSFVKMAGGIRGKVNCYTEVAFQMEKIDGKGFVDIRPDGIIRVVRGKTEWKALIEVKVGNSILEQKQFDNYVNLATTNNFDAMITISNQAALPDGLPPLNVKKRIKRVKFVHFSWERLLSEAEMLCQKKSIADTDQKWMLDEWIRYINDEQSKIVEKPTLGKNWSSVFKSMRNDNHKQMTNEVEDIAQHWIGFLKKIALRLRAKLGVEVQLKLSKADQKNPDALIKQLRNSIIENHLLDGVLKIPGAVSDVYIKMDLKAKRVQYSISQDAPKEPRRPESNINKVLKQLQKYDDVPKSLIVNIDWTQRGVMSFAPMEQMSSGVDPLLRDASKSLIPPRKLFPRKYRFEWTRDFPKSQKDVIILNDIFINMEVFYQSVVERLVPDVPRAPKLPKQETTIVEKEVSIMTEPPGEEKELQA